jgi:hypothetical protein
MAFCFLAMREQESAAGQVVASALPGDFHYSGTKRLYNYNYDDNGNMKTNANKAIALLFAICNREAISVDN